MREKPLCGRWTVTNPKGAASDALPAGTLVVIEAPAGASTYTVTVTHPATDATATASVVYQGAESDTLSGTLGAGGEYGFVICPRGGPGPDGLLGVVYARTIGDGTPSGTWEADESGSEGGSRAARRGWWRRWWRRR